LSLRGYLAHRYDLIAHLKVKRDALTVKIIHKRSISFSINDYRWSRNLTIEDWIKFLRNYSKRNLT